MPVPVHHLLTVWNPSYAVSGLDDHLEVLLRWAEGYDPARAEEDNRYVWWAKLKSPNRQQPLPHIEEILALQNQIEAGHETHLYLTDYRSLYVGIIEEITADDVREEHPGELEHMPAYYADKLADFWFRLTDIRLLVADDTVATIEELKRLRNVRYHDRPVSLYGGMVELPLIVRRDEAVSWFEGRDALTDGRLWAEHDLHRRTDTEQMGRELRDNLIGRRLWLRLQPATRNFLASAETVFRSRRNDVHFDFSGPAIGYAKAVETELAALLLPLLRRALRGRPATERIVNIEGRSVDLGEEEHYLTLGKLNNLLQHNENVRVALRREAPQDASWLVDALPAQLTAVANLRNPAAHDTALGQETASAIREEVMGIGCEGLLVRLLQVRARSL